MFGPKFIAYRSIVKYPTNINTVVYNGTSRNLPDALDKELGFIKQNFDVLKIELKEPDPTRSADWTKGDI